VLTKRYLASAKNLPAILTKMVDGAAPERFTLEHLKSIGFGASSDRAIVPLLKDLGFLTAEGAPTPRYHAYRDRSRSSAVLAEALRETYEDVFHVNEKPTSGDRAAIEGVFRTKHNSTDRVAQLQAATFLALLPCADFDKARDSPITALPRSEESAIQEPLEEQPPAVTGLSGRTPISTELHYTIQVHLPPTKDIEVFNAIFKSLRENLLT